MKLPGFSTDLLAGLVTGGICGLVVGWSLWHPRAAPVEAAAPAMQLPSGGLVVERSPDAAAPASVKRAAKEAGGKLERAISITVQPEPISTPAVVFVADSPPPAEITNPATPAAGCSCTPVRVDLGLVRMPDRTRRVVATADGGEIIGGLDIPLDMPPASRVLRWAAGATYNARQREYGAFIDRDLGPLRLGVEVMQRGEGAAVVLRAGIRF